MPQDAPSPRRKQLTAEGFDQIATFFKVLADPVRLRLLHALFEGERTVMQLMEATDCNQANASKHLKILLEAGLVVRRKQGTHAWYAIGDPSVYGLCEMVCERQEALLAARARLFRDAAS
ncbi:MAG: metalloregulator ArsR/SmtB family transcription factor [Candidatus Sericytochromatia bacterium]|nr:metalloregulator ArsR/SmtB family transcription factor [Candidatus Sericytochromatia bacterium]